MKEERRKEWVYGERKKGKIIQKEQEKKKEKGIMKGNTNYIF